MKHRVLTRRVLLYSLIFVCLTIIYNTDFIQRRLPFWHERPTKHFLVYYEDNSPAQQDIDELAELLEHHYDALADMFNFEISVKIPYFFHNSQLFAGVTPIWGYSTAEGVHAIYTENQTDTSPHELSHFIHDSVNPDAPYFFNEGACGFGIQIGGESFHQKARKRCHLIHEYDLVDLVKRFKQYGRYEDYLAYSFNAFLT